MIRTLLAALALVPALLTAPVPAAAADLSSDSFARLAVLEGGRHKPMDSYAWESVRGIHGRSHYKGAGDRGETRRWEAVDLILDIAAKPQYWRGQKLVRIDYHELKDRLGFPKGEKYFSFDQIVGAPALNGLIEEARRLNADAAASTKLSTETQDLYGRLVVLDELLSGAGFRLIPDPRDHNAEWQNPMEASPQSAQAWRMLLEAWSMDSYARESIRSIHGKSHLKDAQGKRWDPLDLVLDIVSRPEHWRTQKVVLIGLFSLKKKLGFPIWKRYFSFDEIVSKPELGTLIDEARRLNADTATSTKLSMETQALSNRLVVLDGLLSSHGFQLIPDPRDGNAAWLNPLEASPQSAQTWRMQLAQSAADYNQAVTRLQGLIRQTAGADYPSEGAISREIRYNRLQPFHKAWTLYLVLALTSLLAAAVAVFSVPAALRRGLEWVNIGLLLAALGFQTAGLAYITVLTGRAPISNLFESMVFIIWATILLATIFYFVSRRENYLLVTAGVLGTIAMGYALDSTIDISINPLVPVLKSYWLNIHVTVITFSYGAFAVAAGLGHAFLWRYRKDPRDQAALAKIDKLSYRVLGIGIITLTAGIILGAVWANESWGRYWGWDPKETWSLITLLFYMALVHGRMNGWISKRNTAILNIAGLAVVLMTYFGVNYYLTGLHSYATGNPEPFPLKLMVYLALEIAFVLWCLLAGRRKETRTPQAA